MLEKLTTHDI
jgi:hypothetical protein